MFVTLISVCVLLKLLSLEEMAFIWRFFIIFLRLRWIWSFFDKEVNQAEKKLVYGAPARLENKMQVIYWSQKVEKDMHIQCLLLETCASLSTHVQIRLRFVSLFFQLFVVTKRLFFQGRVMSNLRSCLIACVFVYLSLWKRQNQTASCLHSGCQV